MILRVGIKPVTNKCEKILPPNYEQILHDLYKGRLSLSTLAPSSPHYKIELEVPLATEILEMTQKNNLHFDADEWVGLTKKLEESTNLYGDSIYTLGRVGDKLSLMCYGPNRVPFGPFITQQIAGAPDRPIVSFAKLVGEMISNHQHSIGPRKVNADSDKALNVIA